MILTAFLLGCLIYLTYVTGFTHGRCYEERYQKLLQEELQKIIDTIEQNRKDHP